MLFCQENGFDPSIFKPTPQAKLEQLPDLAEQGRFRDWRVKGTSSQVARMDQPGWNSLQNPPFDLGTAYADRSLNGVGFPEGKWVKLCRQGHLVEGRIVTRFGLGRRDIADGFEHAAMIEPVHPFEGCQFHGLCVAP